MFPLVLFSDKLEKAWDWVQCIAQQLAPLSAGAALEQNSFWSWLGPSAALLPPVLGAFLWIQKLVLKCQEAIYFCEERMVLYSKHKVGKRDQQNLSSGKVALWRPSLYFLVYKWDDLQRTQQRLIGVLSDLWVQSAVRGQTGCSGTAHEYC